MKASDIRKWTASVTYQKGRDLYYNRKVLSLEMNQTKTGVTVLSANVKGSGRNIYLTELEIDEKRDTVAGYFCECPAYNTYPRLCKHCVAVLLQYSEYESERQEEGNVAMLENHPAISRGVKKHTTPVLQKLLQKRAENKALPILQNKVYGRVRLEPALSIEYQIRLQFKIGVERMYVLKDVLQFAAAMEAQQSYRYGKLLEFVHTREIFEEDSRPLADFIVDWVSHYRQQHMLPYYGGYYYDGEHKVKEMHLNGAELEQFLLAMGKRKFFYETGGLPISCQVTDETLSRRLKIQSEADGITVSVNYLAGYWGEKHACYFIEDKVYLDPCKRIEGIRDFLNSMSEIHDRTMYIAKEDVPGFCRDLLPALEEVYECEKEGFNAADYGMIPAEFEFYFDAPNNDLVTCMAEVLYGEKKFSLYDETPAGVRDLFREASVRELLDGYTDENERRADGMTVITGDTRIYTLLTEGIAAFQKLGKVFVSDRLKGFRVQQSPKISAGVSLSGDMLELTISSDWMSRKELLEILSRYQTKKKYYRLKNGDFVQMDGDGIGVLHEIQKGLHLTETQLRKEKLQLPKYRALYLDEQGRGKNGFTMEKGRQFRAMIRNMKTIEDNDFELPDSLKKTMRVYQKEGFLWLKTLRHNGFGAILADDMGLGKTLQIISFLLSEWEEAESEDNRRTLIVVPASLVYNWKKELERFAPKLPVTMVTGTAAERKEKIAASTERDILLTSYDLLRRDIEEYEDMPFFCEIIDEAQYIKNHNTKAAHAVKKIQAGFRAALTGTPMENRLSELWSIFDYLMPGFLYSYKQFRQEIEIPVVQGQDQDVLLRLQNMITPFVLRRLKKDVLKELPDKLEETVYAPLEGEQKSLYEARVQKMRLMLDKQTEEEFKTSKIEILSELTRLRQLCCDPALVYEDYEKNSAKLDMCVDLIENAISGNHKILLFSQFTSMLQTIQDRLEERKISFYTLTGNTGKEKRVQLVEKFNNDDTSVFCISLKAGGTGLNLTAADVVIHYDPWWNQAVQNQATDRAHRIGQTNVVTVYKLVVKDTIEENIIRLQERKTALAEQVLGGENIGNANFTKEELLALLAGA